jgi:hypothetical protein
VVALVDLIADARQCVYSGECSMSKILLRMRLGEGENSEGRGGFGFGGMRAFPAVAYDWARDFVEFMHHVNSQRSMCVCLPRSVQAPYRIV